MYNFDATRPTFRPGDDRMNGDEEWLVSDGIGDCQRAVAARDAAEAARFTQVPCWVDHSPSEVAVSECLGRVRLGLSHGSSHHFTPEAARRLAAALIARAGEAERVKAR